MKLHTPQSTLRSTKRGMTLIEISVVILVLLSLITVLFVSARAWKRGSDRTGCIMNIRNVQLAVRSYANMNGLTPGGEEFYVVSHSYDEFPGSLEGAIFGEEGFLSTPPSCPAGGEYNFFPFGVPELGTLALACSLADSDSHIPDDYDGW